MRAGDFSSWQRVCSGPTPICFMNRSNDTMLARKAREGLAKEGHTTHIPIANSTSMRFSGFSGSPCSVQSVSRQVIEHKLLTALEEGGVAAIFSKQDLEDLVFACELWLMRDDRATRLGNLRRGMEQLLREAFPS